MTTIAERLADACRDAAPTPAMETVAENLLIDVAGICIAARDSDFMRAARQAVDPGGPCSVPGAAGGFAPADAAMLNGTAAHGEDFDDTYEGGPVHAGAVILPAALAIAERHGVGGTAARRAIAIGAEITCRLSEVVPKAVHKAGFHPTAVSLSHGSAGKRLPAANGGSSPARTSSRRSAAAGVALKPRAAAYFSTAAVRSSSRSARPGADCHTLRNASAIARASIFATGTPPSVGNTCRAKVDSHMSAVRPDRHDAARDAIVSRSITSNVP